MTLFPRDGYMEKYFQWFISWLATVCRLHEDWRPIWRTGTNSDGIILSFKKKIGAQMLFKWVQAEAQSLCFTCVGGTSTLSPLKDWMFHSSAFSLAGSDHLHHFLLYGTFQHTHCSRRGVGGQYEQAHTFTPIQNLERAQKSTEVIKHYSWAHWCLLSVHKYESYFHELNSEQTLLKKKCTFTCEPRYHASLPPAQARLPACLVFSRSTGCHCSSIYPLCRTQHTLSRAWLKRAN